MNAACVAAGLSRANAYRHLKPSPPVQGPRRRPKSHRRMSDAERANILEVLDSEAYIDQPPREVYASLLSKGIYLCSVRTMYRLLKERGPVRERRAHREHPKNAIPRLEASAPNQVWSWDISKLATLETGSFLNLYVVLDLFSRYVVAWMVAERENSALAKQLFVEAVSRYQIEPGELTVHQDRGAPMTSHTFCDLLAELGVDRSHSRPRVSNDNPHSESLFHTAKYQPDYPGRFRDIGHARQWCQEFFAWYNDAHHHTGLALFTPSDVFYGRVQDITLTRADALAAAYKAFPERFVHGYPSVPQPPPRVFINPPEVPVTAKEIISARPEELDSLLSPAPLVSTPPEIHIPGARSPITGGEQPQIST